MIAKMSHTPPEAEGATARWEEVECLVPGAGRSERMGSWKPALAFGESTIIQTVV